jgi:hypothetical protein
MVAPQQPACLGTALAKSSSDPLFSGEGDNEMSKLLRGVAAGWGAKKLGGGCFTTILVFILLWWLLGNFSIFQ